MQSNDVLIIGAGIVGLATAYQLLKAKPSLKLLILEKEKEVGLHQTGRNSGVIHSGVYYKPGSLKAKNCLEGRKALLQFCEEQEIPTQKLGKVIIATKAEELGKLLDIAERGRLNGVQGLELIGPERLKEIEPHVSALQALWVPECHVVHFGTVASRLAQAVRALGGEIALETEVTGIKNAVVETSRQTYHAGTLINCAGLFSDRIARLSKEKVEHQILPFRGEYFELSKRELVNGLIYPVPNPKFPFLGVHLTRRIDGSVEAGPNAVLAFAREGYRKRDFNGRDCLEYLKYPGFWKMAGRYGSVGLYELYRSFRKRAFLKDVQKLIPAIEEKDLASGGSGVRAQVVTRDGKLLDDFALLQEGKRYHVLNAPSPAATASFAIGRFIAHEVLCTR
jgi:L-2-hydroxyglutarate oxidase